MLRPIPEISSRRHKDTKKTNLYYMWTFAKEKLFPKSLRALVPCANPTGSFGKASLWEWQSFSTVRSISYSLGFECH